MPAPDPQIVEAVEDVVTPRGAVLQSNGEFRPVWWRWLWRFVRTVNGNFDSVAGGDATSSLLGQIEELRTEIAQLRLQLGSFVGQRDDYLPLAAASDQREDFLPLSAVVDQREEPIEPRAEFVAADPVLLPPAAQPLDADLSITPPRVCDCQDADPLPVLETGHLAVRDAFERFASVTVTRDASNNSGNQAILAGSQSGASPLKPVTLSVAAGSTDTNVGIALITKGTGAIMADIPDSAASGGNARGTRAVDLQMDRAAAASVASGANAFAAGNNNTASGQASVTLGQNNIASATGSVAFGSGNTISGITSFGAGNSSSDRGINGSRTFAGSRFVSAGDAQMRETVHMVTTAAAAAVRLTTDNAAAAATNVLVLPNNSAYLVSVEMVARDVTAGTAWTFTLGPSLIYRGANAAATIAGAGNPVFVAGPTANGPAAIATVPTLTADTTNGAVNISFTPPVGNTNTIRIVARVQTTEVV